MNVLCRTMMFIEAGGSPGTNEPGKEVPCVPGREDNADGEGGDGREVSPEAGVVVAGVFGRVGLTDTDGPSTI